MFCPLILIFFKLRHFDLLSLRLKFCFWAILKISRTFWNVWANLFHCLLVTHIFQFLFDTYFLHVEIFAYYQSHSFSVCVLFFCYPPNCQVTVIPTIPTTFQHLDQFSKLLYSQIFCHLMSSFLSLNHITHSKACVLFIVPYP